MNIPESVFAWWNARESKEQKLLLVGGLFAVAAALYALANPILSMYQASVQQFRQADSDHLWLKEQVQTLEQLRSEAGGALPVFLSPDGMMKKIKADMKKKKFKGKVAVENVDGVQRVRVKLDGNDGRQVMRWLEELANGGYIVSSFSLGNKGGRLSGTIVIGI